MNDSLPRPDDLEGDEASEETTNSSEIVVENAGINYELLQKEEKRKLEFQEDFVYFISHASKTSRTRDGEQQPLPGELDFVKLLLIELEKLDGKPKVYVDFRNNPQFDWLTFIRALKSSKYCIFVCSPRFIERFKKMDAPFLNEEIKQFWTLKNTHKQPERVIPISFGVDLLTYDLGPFSSSDYMIDSGYGGALTIEDMVKKVISEISKTKIN